MNTTMALPPFSSDSQLASIHVLLDGYNLQMPMGTGIKTYTLSLMQALKSLGLKTSVLTSLPGSANPLLAEVLCADDRAREEMDLRSASSPWGYGRVVLKIGKHLRKLWWDQPQVLTLSGRVNLKDSPLRSLLQADQILNLEGCYEMSRLLHSLLPQQTTIRCQQSIHLWHRTYPILPLKVRSSRPTVNVVTICDLIPLKLPYLTRDRKDEYYRALKTVLRDRPLVTTISQQSRHDILEFFDLDPDRVSLTYLPIAPTPLTQAEGSSLPAQSPPLLTTDQLERFLGSYGLKSQQYFLFVGTIEPRKNLSLVLQAYRALNTSWPLVVVGKLGWRSEKELAPIESLFGPSWYRRIKLLNFVNSQELPYFYQGAFCLVFPSLYEGFGLPPLEAMSWGCPVLSSHCSSLPEVCGEAALYFDPHDRLSLQNRLEQLLTDPALRSQLVSAGIAQAKQFSLDRFCQALWKAYSQVL